MSSEAWFSTAFNDSLYTDDASDFGPFGNDTGADIFASWAARHPHKEAGHTVRDVLRETWTGTSSLTSPQTPTRR